MTKQARKEAPIHADQTISETFKSLLQSEFDYLIQWEEAAKSWDNIEGVHQVRVSFRRMRAALSVFRSAIPRQATAEWSEEMRWLANQLGMARDLDVFIDEGLGTIRGKLPLRGEDKMAALAEQHRAAAYETVLAMLEGDRYARFKDSYSDWLTNEGWRSGDIDQKYRKRMESDVVSFARRLLDKQERRVLEAGNHVNQDSPEEMHQLRIQCKKLRYGAEFFSPIFVGIDEFISHMKGLQNLLGMMNDVTVMKRLLDGLLEGETDVEVLEYAGGLVGWRTCQYYAMKNSFDERWEEFVHAKHPWWKKPAHSH